MKITVDGNSAASYIAYAFSEIASIYPITPSSPMAENADEWQSKNVKNLFGNTVAVNQLQSEAGVAGAVHGSLSAGSLTTTFTASQGLLLMIPNMYKIAGELLPTVFHVSARALSTHALSIFGDHADVMACRSTGFAMLCSTSVQEAMDMATVAHIATLKSSVPFLHFFDGFRTSHEINKIDNIEYEDLLKVLPRKEIAEFKARGLSSLHPHQQGTAQNPDIYFQNREACNPFYKNVEASVKQAMEDLYKITGRRYKFFDYYGAEDAENIIVIMGSGYQTALETVKYLNKLGKKVGVVSVHLYRPFSAEELVNTLPKTTKRICVLDRTKEPGSGGEPLYKDVCTALQEMSKTDITVVGGRYGLGGKEFTPCMVKSVYDNLEAKNPLNDFSVGINDDVTNKSITIDETFDIEEENYSCKFFGLGSDGTVSANKNSIKIIGGNTDLNAQGYFEYDSKKSGSVTISHLRFGKGSTNAPYLITKGDFIACHNISFVGKYDMAEDLKQGGKFLLNSPYPVEDLNKILPASFFKALKDKNAKLYVVDGNKVAENAGLGKRINVVMQACFFKITDIIPYEKVEQMLIDAASKTYKNKGQAIVDANVKAIKLATEHLVEVDLDKMTGHNNSTSKNINDKYYKEQIEPIEHKKGDNIPVSAFDPRGFIPTDTAKYEKRGISVTSPCWIKENCIQCNMCSFVCPHAAIRPVLIDKDEKQNAPASFDTAPALGIPNKEFRMQINVADCTGCENCVKVCPAKNKALQMQSSVELQEKEKENYEYSKDIENPETIFKPNTIKGSQFNKPYFEFSGAWAGCGETPYVKLVSQLFGKRLLVSNATGCSSIYSGSAPTCPYAKNKEGRGPAWASSLFEDNAEFGFGIYLAKKQQRERLIEKVNEYLPTCKNEELATLLKEWQDNIDDGDKTYDLTQKLLPLIKGTELEEFKDAFTKETVWIIGGDGWAYDIGYGGLDQVLASGENINVLVLDTEVYSNTGGQMSKSTPFSATAKFAAAGKRTPKKDLGRMAMTYKNIYVAQIGMGADMNQAVKAISEAEAYNGPSLIIAYAPCINHGINMNGAQDEIKKAVQSGYWHLYRYNPDLIEQGKNPFTLDSREPTLDYEEFLKGESRYAALQKLSPELAKKLYEQSKKFAEERYQTYRKLAGLDTENDNK